MKIDKSQFDLASEEIFKLENKLHAMKRIRYEEVVYRCQEIKDCIVTALGHKLLDKKGQPNFILHTDCWCHNCSDYAEGYSTCLKDDPIGTVSTYFTIAGTHELSSGKRQYAHIPVEFLFMDDTEITKVIKDEIISHNETQKKRRETIDKKKAQIKKTKDEALKKLTDEEKMALGLA